MELKFNLESTKKIIETYYSETTDFKGKVTSRVEKGSVGLYEEMGAIVSIRLKGKIKVLDAEVEVEKTVTPNEVTEAFKHVLAKSNIEVEDVNYISGLRSRTVGFGMGESTEHIPYFNGVMVRVKNNTKLKEI